MSWKVTQMSGSHPPVRQMGRQSHSEELPILQTNLKKHVLMWKLIHRCVFTQKIVLMTFISLPLVMKTGERDI